MSVPYKAIRIQISEGTSKLLAACKLMRDAGLEELPDELSGLVKRINVFTQENGWLDAYEARDNREAAKEKDDAPSG